MDKIAESLTTNNQPETPVIKPVKYETGIASSYLTGAQVAFSPEQEAAIPEPMPQNTYFSNLLRDVSKEDIGVLEASFKSDNTAVNVYQFLTAPEFPPEDHFNLLDHKDKLYGLEAYMTDLARTKSTKELYYKLQKIAEKQYATQVVHDSDTIPKIVAITVANVADPVKIIFVIICFLFCKKIILNFLQKIKKIIINLLSSQLGKEILNNLDEESWFIPSTGFRLKHKKYNNLDLYVGLGFLVFDFANKPLTLSFWDKFFLYKKMKKIYNRKYKQFALEKLYE